MKKPIIRLTYIIILILGLLVTGCSTRPKAKQNEAVNLSANEEDPAVWGKYYPREYESWLKNKEESKTEFGGSVPESHLDKKPYLRELYKGYGFGEDYNEERGHVYAVEDVLKIKRITPKSVASCWNCKTPTAPKQIATQGVSWYSKPFSEVKKDVKHGISCWDCHDPKTMKLRVTRQNMIEAFKRQGKDVNASSQKEMRTYVCAQCHNEYYFKTDTKEVTNPWDTGYSAQAAVDYYNKLKFTDWKHPESGTDMIKMQHPEFEMSNGSPHQAAGVSCADCHMPYIKEGNNKYSSHWMTSPLKTIDVSCKTCHAQDTDWLKGQVHDKQTRTNELVDIAGEENVRAIRTIATASKATNANQAKLEQARQFHRTSQAYWDWVYSENSMGFHNTQKAMYTLGLSINNARQAQVLASEAAGKALNPSIVDIPEKQTDNFGEKKQPDDKVKVPKENP